MLETAEIKIRKYILPNNIVKIIKGIATIETIILVNILLSANFPP